MANVFLTNLMITNEALMILDHSLSFYQTITTTYDDQFAQTGAKNGDVLDIRLPPKYIVNDGATYIPQDNIETKARIQVTQKHVGLAGIQNADHTLRIDIFGERFIRPAMAPLANRVDADALKTTKQIWNIVGTAGTSPNSLLTYGDALTRLTNEGVPLGNLKMCTSPNDSNVIVDANKGLFQSAEQIKTQYEKNKMGIAAGFEWLMDPHVYKHTNGAFGGTLTVDGAVANGADTINVQGLSASQTGAFLQGDHFTVAGVNAVIAQTYVDAGYLRHFVVTEDVDADGTGRAAVKVAPVVNGPGTGGQQTVTALPADSAAVTPFGSAGQSYRFNVGYHPDAFACAFVDLMLPAGLHNATRATHRSGIRMTYLADFFIKEYEEINRLDILNGEVCHRPEMACIVAGGAA